MDRLRVKVQRLGGKWLEQARSIWINIRYGSKAPEVRRREYAGYIIVGIKPLALREVLGLYRTLNEGKQLPLSKIIVFVLMGSRWCLGCYERKTNSLVGIGLNYLNGRDIRENTAHVGFTGVSEAYRGRGVGTLILRCTLKHFEAAGFNGVSLRVSSANAVAVNLYKNEGFVIVESCHDRAVGSNRHYMVRLYR